MRDFHLRFCWDEKGWFDHLFNLLEEDSIYEAPESGGAYILGTSDGTMLTYPWGSSPIYYIGKADDLRERIRTHRNNIIRAEEDHDELYWWPRYQYGAAFGADCAYYSRRGTELPQNVEATLIRCFYEQFGSIPTSNSSWPKEIRPKRN